MDIENKERIKKFRNLVKNPNFGEFLDFLDEMLLDERIKSDDISPQELKDSQGYRRCLIEIKDTFKQINDLEDDESRSQKTQF